MDLRRPPSTRQRCARSIQDAVSDRSRAVHQVVRALIAVLIVSLIGAIGSPARCAAKDDNSTVVPHREETSIPYVVRVYFDQVAKDGSDSYYEILKNGKSVFKQKARGKGEKYFIGTMYDDDPDAALVKMGMDITGAGQPDVVISEWSGGANCCLTFHIFEIGSTFRKIGSISAMYGDAGPHFAHADKDSKAKGLQVQISDWTFANWHSDFADSPAPKVILRFSESDGTYRISPDLMRSPIPAVSDLDARTAEIRNHKNNAKGNSWPAADVSPTLWGTMLDLIYSGHAGDAWKFLDKAWPPKIGGKEAFARDFRAQLAKSPYWSAVVAANSSGHMSDNNAATPKPSPSAPPVNP